MKKIALVLPGAGVKGAWYEGIVRYLEDKKVPIWRIYGASIGSLEGVLVAKGVGRHARQAIWQEIGKKFHKLAKKQFRRFFFFFGYKSLRNDKRLKTWLKKHFDFNFEDLEIPMSISVCNLNNGTNKIYTGGSIADAVIASSALVPLLSYWPMNGYLAVDGGVNNNIMLDQAVSDGAEIIILPIVNRLKIKNKFKNWLYLLFRVLEIKLLQEQKSEVEKFHLHYPKIKLYKIESSETWVSDQSALDFSLDYIKNAIDLGYKDAEKAQLGSLVAEVNKQENGN